MIPLEEEADDELRDKARFCLLTGVAPSEYDAMTEAEVAAFIEVANELAEARKP